MLYYSYMLRFWVSIWNVRTPPLRRYSGITHCSRPLQSVADRWRHSRDHLMFNGGFVRLCQWRYVGRRRRKTHVLLPHRDYHSDREFPYRIVLSHGLLAPQKCSHMTRLRTRIEGSNSFEQDSYYVCVLGKLEITCRLEHNSSIGEKLIVHECVPFSALFSVHLVRRA